MKQNVNTVFKNSPNKYCRPVYKPSAILRSKIFGTIEFNLYTPQNKV